MNVRVSLPIALAMGVFAIFASSAQAAEPTQEITITGTRVDTIPYDFATRRPVKEVTVTASVPANLDVLTLNSGVALLQDSVRDAAVKACLAADPYSSATADTTTDCVRRAVRDAQPQINALIERARVEEKARWG
jgi:UrcA family protein